MLTQLELSNELGTSQPTLSRWLKSRPDLPQGNFDEDDVKLMKNEWLKTHKRGVTQKDLDELKNDNKLKVEDLKQSYEMKLMKLNMELSNLKELESRNKEQLTIKDDQISNALKQIERLTKADEATKTLLLQEQKLHLADNKNQSNKLIEVKNENEENKLKITEKDETIEKLQQELEESKKKKSIFSFWKK